MRLSKRGKRRLLAAAGVVGLAIGGAATVKYVRHVQQERLIAERRTEGLAAYAAADYDETLAKLSYYLQYQRDDVEALTAFADARAQRPKVNNEHLLEAIGYYMHALDTLDAGPRDDASDVRTVEILHELIDLRRQLGHRFELLSAAERILEIDADDIDALEAKATILFVERRFDEVEPVAARLIELQPHDVGWRHLHLEAQRGLGVSGDELLEQTMTWAKAFDGDGRFHVLAAAWASEQGRNTDARDLLMTAASRGADDTETLQQLVAMLDLFGLDEPAEQLLEDKIAAAPDDPAVYATMVRRHWRRNELVNAAATVDRAHETLTTMDPELRRWSTMIHIARGETAAAAEALAALRNAVAAETDPSDELAPACLDALALRTSDEPTPWPQARRVYDNAIAAAPTDAFLHFLRGEAARRVGEAAVAERSFRQAAALDPNWIGARLAHAEALLAIGQSLEARAAAREALRRAPEGQPAPYVMYARAAAAARRDGAAAEGGDIDLIPLLRGLRTQLPDLAEFDTLLFEAYMTEDRLGDAQRLVDELLDDPGATDERLLRLASACLTADLMPAAQALMDRAASLGGRTPLWTLLEAERLATADRMDEAVDLLNTLDDVAASDETLARRRAGFLVRHRRPEATAALEQLVDRFPTTETLSFALDQSAFWRNESAVRAATDALRKRLGGEAHQVRLADAARRIRFHADDEVALAGAILDVTRILDEAPDSLPALTLMAEANLTGLKSNPREAALYLARAVDLYPNRTGLYPQLITLLQQTGDFAEADRRLRKLDQLLPDDPTLRQLQLQLLTTQGDFAAAADEAKRLADPDSEMDQLLAAQLAVRAGRMEEAGAIYDELLASDEPSDLAVLQAAAHRAMSGDVDGGRAVLAAASFAGDASAAALARGEFERRFGDVSRAIEAFRAAVAAAPEEAHVHHQLARTLLQARDAASAREAATAGLRIAPNDPALRAVLALAMFATGESDRGRLIEAIRGAAETDADQTPDGLTATLSLLERVPVRDGRMTPTDDDLDEARRITEDHPQFLPAWRLAVFMHRDAGRGNEAQRLARAATNRLPTAPEPAQWLVDLLVASEAWDQAKIAAEEWRRRTMHEPLEADLMIASLLLKLDRPRDAAAQIAAHRAALTARPLETPEQTLAWARVMVAAGRHAEVLRTLGPALESDRSWRFAFIPLASWTTSDEAAATLLEAVEPLTAGDEINTLRVMQEWLRLASETTNDAAPFVEGVRRMASRLENAAPDRAAASSFARGVAAEIEDDLDAARQAYERAIEIRPSYAAALNNLAMVELNATAAGGPGSSDAATRALSYIERALQSAPDEPALLDTQAQALTRLGRHDEALQTVDAALTSRPEDAAMHLTRADVLLRAGRVDDARETLDEAARLLALAGPAPGLDARLASLRRRAEARRTTAAGEE